MLRAAGWAAILGMFLGSTTQGADAPARWQGWTGTSPRDEVRPKFSVNPKGGPGGHGSLVIEADARQGLDGRWTKVFPVSGGKWYELACMRRLENVPVPRRCATARVTWLDAQGKRVMHDGPIEFGYRPGSVSRAEPEYAHERGPDRGGWTTVSGVFCAPQKAAQGLVELQLCWAAGGKAEFADVTLGESSAPTPRKARLAAVHLRPTGGKTPAERCRLFEPLIQEAARQHADLVVLPETLTQYASGKTYAEVAEPMPGPSSRYFAELAKRHNLYIVAGLIERDGPLIYNVAVLLSPEGKIAGKYRKVTLPRGEHEQGVCPGSDYPVFETRFGKLGMMVCYDGFFPEVARELSNRGAEVIAWPVAGCNPLLARARACENQVYVVSSTYTDSAVNWMQTAVYDPYGEALAVGKEWNTVAVAEVDLNRPTIWNSMGDFKSEMQINRPLSTREAAASAPVAGKPHP